MLILGILLLLAVEGLALWGVATLCDAWLLAILALVATSFWGASLLSKARDGLDPMKLQGLMMQPGGLASGLVSSLAPMFAGVLILIPGFLTDIVGISLLFPVTRKLWTPVILWAVQRGVRAAASGKFGPVKGQGKGAAGQMPAPEQLKAFEYMLKNGAPPPAPGTPGGGPRIGGQRLQKKQKRQGGGGEKRRDADYRVID